MYKSFGHTTGMFDQREVPGVKDHGGCDPFVDCGRAGGLLQASKDGDDGLHDSGLGEIDVGLGELGGSGPCVGKQQPPVFGPMAKMVAGQLVITEETIQEAAEFETFCGRKPMRF
uniref:Uncharacterized protein n=1 Tax=Arundo donax TaxID=35708 RepID=A0A0A9BC18_ARUDO